MYIRAFEAVSCSCLTTPLSLKRLPSISMPMRGAVEGSMQHTTIVTITGNIILSRLETGLSCSILILRSFSVVSALMIGGWMIGTSDMYE